MLPSISTLTKVVVEFTNTKVVHDHGQGGNGAIPIGQGLGAWIDVIRQGPVVGVDGVPTVM